MKSEKKRTNHSDHVAAAQYFQEVLKKRNSKNVARDERKYAAELHYAGRNAYFKEYFEEISLENQELPKIGPYENIIETHHFKEGYKKGAFLVEIGAIPEEYQQLSETHKKR